MYEDSLRTCIDFINGVKYGLAHVNRFSVDRRLDEAICRYVNNEPLQMEIHPGKILYRARIYREKDAEDRYFHPVDGAFKGYGEADSFVNLSPSVSEGRCNPSGIPYLYASALPECCIAEVRPFAETYVSVAEIKVEQPLRVLQMDGNLFRDMQDKDIVPGVLNGTLLSEIAIQFEQLDKGDGEYLFCQYVAEKIKNYGYDAISYCSAAYPPQTKEDEKKKTNVNYVIFSYRKCKAVSSLMYKVKLTPVPQSLRS